MVGFAVYNYRPRTEIHSYEEAKEYLLATPHGRSKLERPLANNTKIFMVDDTEEIIIRLHNTNIITYYPDGSIILDSGRWRTVTTKERLNRFSPANVWQDKGVWYISGDWNTPKKERQLFYDGIDISKPPSKYRVYKERMRIKKLLKLLDNFLKKLRELIIAGELKRPGAGDCWLCAPVSDGKLGESVADASGDPERHIISHLEECYVVPQLVWNAIAEAQYGGGEEFAWQYLIDGYTNESDYHRGGRANRTAQHVRRYIKKRLGIAR